LLEGQLRKAEQVIGTVGYLSVLVVLDEARFRLLVDEVALLPSNTEAVSTLGVTPYALDLMIHNRDAIPLTCAIEDKGPGLVKISIEKSEIVRFKKSFGSIRNSVYEGWPMRVSRVIC